MKGVLRHGVMTPRLLQQFRNQPGPPRLVACPDASAVVAVEVFVEQKIVAKIGVLLESFIVSKDRPPAPVVFCEDPNQPA